jgi:hypothetical protein
MFQRFVQAKLFDNLFENEFPFAQKSCSTEIYDALQFTTFRTWLAPVPHRSSVNHLGWDGPLPHGRRNQIGSVSK